MFQILHVISACFKESKVQVFVKFHVELVSVTLLEVQILKLPTRRSSNERHSSGHGYDKTPSAGAEGELKD